MISILAPSKTLDFTPAPEWVHPQEPLFVNDAQKIADVLASMDIAALTKLMSVSSEIAQTNHDRFAKWGSEQKPALWAYRGDVYKGMYADALSKDDAAWAEGHIRIMSGLYGVLRPHDGVSPYRLEMKAKLGVGDAKDLYEFWGDKLARTLDEESDGIICVLSSEEYAKPITKYAKSRIVTPVFMDHKPNGKIGPVPIYSKMMRGVMARWIIDHRVDSPEGLLSFDGHGYIYNQTRSKENAPVFVRPAPMTPLVF